MREGILPGFPNSGAPEFNFDSGQLVVPHPPTSREEIQEPFVRNIEIPPEEYYPDGYHRELLTEWPVESDLVIPLEDMPPAMLQGMGENWRDRQAYKKHISELAAEND